VEESARLDGIGKRIQRILAGELDGDAGRRSFPVGFDDRSNRAVIDHVFGALELEERLFCYFTGPVGCGKTYLGHLAMQFWRGRLAHRRELLRRLSREVRDEVSYWDGIGLTGAVSREIETLDRAIGAERRLECRTIWDRYRSDGFKQPRLTDVMLLDDLGAEPESGAAGEFMISVLTGLYERRDRMRLLIITSNLDSAGVQRRYGDRIADRIVEMCDICKFKSQSYRRKQARIIGG